MGHLVASPVHIVTLLAQYALNAQFSHTITEYLETADTFIILVKLDVSNHNGPYVSIAGHKIPELATLSHV